jgi:hypothetical protein
MKARGGAQAGPAGKAIARATAMPRAKAAVR